MRVVIVDDEEPARNLLREYLDEMPETKVVAECANGFEAVKAVSETDPDLLLLDIQMPKLDGFEVLELLERDMPVVFITAYDEHAVRAFEVHAVDYLLKPCSAERLQEAVERVRQRLGTAASPPPIQELAAAVRTQPAYLERLLVRDGTQVHVIPVNDVDFVEAADDALVICVGKARFRKSQRLSELERRLSPSRFARIHRSFLLNLDRLERLELYAKDSRIAILNDGTKLPVSRSCYARLKELL
ncbi:MAG: response regulator transcription factor [bacterium]|nr:response regulator transcription factor [bacterium]